MKNERERFISVVLTAEEAANPDSFARYILELEQFLDSHWNHYEIVVLDDGNHFELESIKKALLQESVSIRWINTMRLANRDALPAIGIENAIGDYVVFLRALCDPFDIIPSLVECCIRGKGIVVGVADTPATWGYRLVFGLSKKWTPVRCLGRDSINAILKTEGGMKLLSSRFPVKTFEYVLADTAVVKKKNLMTGFGGFWKSFFSLSSPNFKWIGRGGLVGSFCGVLLSAYSILVHFFKENVVEGWTTTIFFVSIFFTILFVTIIFMGEYMESLLDEIRRKNRSYVVSEERSKLSMKKERLNVANP